MCEQVCIDAVEHAGPHQKRLARQLLFSHARPEHDRAGNFLPRHELLHRQRGNDVERHAAVVPFAVSWRTAHQRVARRRTGLLVGLRNAVDVGAQGDHRRSAAPLCHPRRRDPGHTPFNGEAVLLQHARQILRCLGFLHPEFTEREDLIDHLLCESGAPIDTPDQLGFEDVDAGVGACLRAKNRRKCRAENQQSGKGAHHSSAFGGVDGRCSHGAGCRLPHATPAQWGRQPCGLPSMAPSMAPCRAMSDTPRAVLLERARRSLIGARNQHPIPTLESHRWPKPE